MSATISTIPASTVVDVIPSALNAGGSALDLIGLLLTPFKRTPIGSVLSFPTQAAVAAYYGGSSIEAQEATVYFNGRLNGTKLPAAMLIAQYNQNNVGAYLRGGNISGLTLTQLQAISGVLTVTIDGVVQTSSAINLSAATSFSNAAQLVEEALALTGPTEASVTGSMGATFTGNASGTNLTVTSASGVIHPGSAASALISGTGITGGTYIVSQTSGTTGGNGVYVTSASTTASSASVTCLSNVLDVSAIGSGTLRVGQQLTGTNITAGTEITAFGTGTGLTGTYITTTTQGAVAVSETITAVTPVVSYDSQSGAFVVVSSTTGASSTISFGSGTIAVPLLLTQATGAVLSQGAVAATPTPFMNAITLQTQDWATVWLAFDPDNGSGNANKLLFAQWNSGQNNRYVYAAEDYDITATQSTNATTSLGNIIQTDEISGTITSYTPIATSPYFLGAFVAAYGASLDFDRTNGRATLAFKYQSGLGITVSNATQAANLKANGYNFTGEFATANQDFNWFMYGSISGEFEWADSYYNQIQLNNALQLALMELLNNVGSIPYNPAGYSLIRQACLDPINAALNFGTIRANVPLSDAQIAEVNNAAGVQIDGILSSVGWYLQINAATAQVRQARGSPPMTLWYMDGGSVQQITLASILVQ